MTLSSRRYTWLVALLAGIPAVLSADAAGADYTVHTLQPAVTNHVILQDGPLPDVCKELATMEVFACAGEYEPASFVVTASKPLENVRVEVGSIAGPGQPWPREAIDVRVVKEIQRDMIGVSVVMPTLLVRDETFIQVDGGVPAAAVNPDTANTNEAGFLTEGKVPTGVNVLKGEFRDAAELQPVTIGKRKQFWITVRIPDDAQPGTYEAPVRIVPGNGDASELKLKIHVHPFDLAAPMIEYSIYYPAILAEEGAPDWRNGAWTMAAHISEEQYIAECRNMIAHGVTNPNIYGGVLVKSDGTLDFSNVERLLAVREKAGIARGVPLYLFNSAAEPVARPLTDEEKAERIRIVREVMAWGKARGYPDIYWTGIDEAWGETLSMERDSFQAIKDGGGKVFVATGIQFYDRVGDVLALPILQSSLYGHLMPAAAAYPPDQLLQNADEIAKAGSYRVMADLDVYRKCIDGTHRLGNKIYTYMNPPGGIALPDLQRRSEGLALWRIGFDGTMTWAYTHIKGEGVDQSMLWGKVMRVDGGVLDTLHWEGFREGVDDVRYLTTLLETLARARGSFPDDHLIGETDKWLAGIDVSGGDLDSIRREMAARIVALSDLGYKELSAEEALAGVDQDTVQIIAFPEPWKFKLVPAPTSVLLSAGANDIDLGLREKWFDPAFDDSQWGMMRTDTKEQGWGQDSGIGWYRATLPAGAPEIKGKFTYLYFGACDEEAQVYINGEMAFDHSLRATGLLTEQIWLMPFVVPLNELGLNGNDSIAVRVTNTELLGGIWKPVRLVLSDQELTKQQVKALVESNLTEN